MIVAIRARNSIARSVRPWQINSDLQGIRAMIQGPRTITYVGNAQMPLLADGIPLSRSLAGNAGGGTG